jgi:hypothetical protein
MTIYRYTAFGLTIATELCFPAWHPGVGPPDVVVRYGDVPDTLGPLAEQHGEYQVTSSAVLLQVAGVGRFWVHDGTEIVMAPASDAREDGLRLIVWGTAFGALLHQRGLLALHASAIMVPEGSVAFAGPSGVGESTLATACWQQGYPILADDICVITASDDGTLMAYPGYPQVKLWPDALRHLEIASAPLRRVHPLHDKRCWPAGEAWTAVPQPLRRVYILSPATTETCTITPLTSVDKIAALAQHTYRRQFLTGLGLREQHFVRLAAVARQVPVCRVERSPDMAQLAVLVTRLAADWPR